MAFVPALGIKPPDPIADWDAVDLTEGECKALGTMGINIDRNTHVTDQRLTRIVRELEKNNMNVIELPFDQ